MKNKYYSQIKNLIEDYEVKRKVRYMQDNHERLLMNWHIGKLLVEAQGGMSRAKYGDGLIKEWSKKLSEVYGNKYGYTNLSNMRRFYMLFPILRSLSEELTWTHYRYLLPIKNESERNYYINQVILNHLSVRELREMIKNKTYDRLSYADKENIELITDSSNTHLTIEDMIKDPILIKLGSKEKKLDEKALHKYIIGMLETRFLELGTGFTLAGHEYKIQISNHTYKIDLLFFNVNLNCYVVVELKTREYHPKDIGQLQFYVDYINENVKLSNHHPTIGLLIVKKKDKYVIEYVTNEDIYVTTYKLVV